MFYDKFDRVSILELFFPHYCFTLHNTRSRSIVRFDDRTRSNPNVDDSQQHIIPHFIFSRFAFHWSQSNRTPDIMLDRGERISIDKSLARVNVRRISKLNTSKIPEMWWIWQPVSGESDFMPIQQYWSSESHQNACCSSWRWFENGSFNTSLEEKNSSYFTELRFWRISGSLRPSDFTRWLCFRGRWNDDPIDWWMSHIP
jgi:hypothetical protein